MNNKTNYITLNGISFSENMINRLYMWYNQGMKEDDIPNVIIKSLEDVQRFIVIQSEANQSIDEESMRVLRKLLFVIDEVKPFTEGGLA